MCSVCRQAPRNFDRALAAGPYEGNLRLLIHHYKFGRQERLHRPLALLLLKIMEENPEFRESDFITYVPLHPTRLRERGFDQARLLAARLSRLTGIPCRRLLKKIRHTPPQSAQSLARREANVRLAYRAGCPRLCREKSILLVDDTCTTGATADACSLLLKSAGATRVRLITLARVEIQH